MCRAEREPDLLACLRIERRSSRQWDISSGALVPFVRRRASPSGRQPRRWWLRILRGPLAVAAFRCGRAEALQPAMERLAVQSEDLGRDALVAVAQLQHAQDVAALDLLQRDQIR